MKGSTMANSIAHFHDGCPEERRQYATYPSPKTCMGMEEHQRLAHRNLAHLDVRQLERERYRMRHRAVLDDVPEPWLAEQLAALDVGLGRRGSGWM